MIKCYSIRVKGKVQGVFFRASTKEQAERFSLKGFVRNENDGSVYIEAVGEETALNEFVDWCRRGPAHARVDDCIVNEIGPKDFPSFDVRR